MLRGLALWIVLCGSSACAARAQGSASDTLYLTHFDVGQGDATLITTPRRKHILIDAGPSGANIAARLRLLRVDTLDLLISSHNHLDHIGGMPDVFAALVVRAYMDNGVPTTTQIYRRTIAYAEAEPGLRYLEATDRTITVDSVTLRILPPPHLDRTQNNNSVGVLIEFGSFRALYTGDSQRLELTHWLAQNRTLHVHVLKAAHHGSSNGITSAWIARTNPGVVVISAGRNNRYGHPAHRVVQAWLLANAKVHRTDCEGIIQVSALRDGSFSVETDPDARLSGCSRD